MDRREFILGTTAVTGALAFPDLGIAAPASAGEHILYLKGYRISAGGNRIEVSRGVVAKFAEEDDGVLHLEYEFPSDFTVEEMQLIPKEEANFGHFGTCEIRYL